jgi:hypothetical protein
LSFDVVRYARRLAYVLHLFCDSARLGDCTGLQLLIDSCLMNILTAKDDELRLCKTAHARIVPSSRVHIEATPNMIAQPHQALIYDDRNSLQKKSYRYLQREARSGPRKLECRNDVTVEPVPGEEHPRKWRSAKIATLASDFAAIVLSGVFVVISRFAKTRCWLVILNIFSL